MPKLDNATAKAVHKAEGSAFTMLDEDKYRAKLDKVTVAPRPDRNGNTYWIWDFSVVSGEITEDKFAGKTFRTNTGWAENQHWFAKMVFDAFEAKPNVDTDELIGHEVYALIGIREIQQGARKGQKTNDVSQLLSIKAGEAESQGDDWTEDAKADDTDAEDTDF